MSLNCLLTDLFGDLYISDSSISINGITTDSRKVVSGNLFIAICGIDKNGIDYIDEAINKGAVAIVVDDKEIIKTKPIVPVIRVPNLYEKVGEIASRFYKYPSKSMKIIGVTGTNGKTTVSYLIANALHLCGLECSLIGTLGYGKFKQLESGTLTTPEPIKLHSLFSKWLDEVDYIAMEVSSHALAQKRVSGIEFELAVFTNISRDHLDYHNSLEKYAETKSLLFKSKNLKYAVINIDDSYGLDLIKNLPNTVDKVAYSLNGVDPELKNISTVYGVSEQLNELKTKLKIDSPWGNFDIETSLLGEFNLENILAVFTALCLLGVEKEQLIKSISSISHIPGRMEFFSSMDKPSIVVDYAHTPDALEKTLVALNSYCKGKLHCVFGCGGNRDRGKREKMGKIAESLADNIILTNDNPREESPEIIIKDILKGIRCKDKVNIKYDRNAAITNAFLQANKKDIVLVAGKGHEVTQQIGANIYPFNDREIALRLTSQND